jgi:phage tail sheath gpL-like
VTIPFQNIPANLRVPLFFAEVNNSQANTDQQTQRALIIGQITSSGIAVPNTPVVSMSAGDGAVKGGQGSHLDAMTRAYRANDTFGELWYLPLSDAVGATAASGAIVITGTATSAGTYSLYIAGQLISVPIASGTTAAAAATALFNAINAVGALPVTATNGTAGTVTITAKNAGLCGNDIDIRFNYLDVRGGQTYPPGLTAAVTAMSGGATNPNLTTGLANLVDRPYDFIISPYTDPASIAAITAFLSDTTGRWSWETQVYGHCFIAYRGSPGGLTSFGAGLNDQHLTCMGFWGSPSPNFAWAAAVAGAVAVSVRADPARPLQTLTINGVLAPPIVSRFSLSTRNALLYDGISTFTVQQGGLCAIENLITTYQLNSFGQPDNSYLEVETMFTLMSVLRTLAAAVTSNFARVKLAADGTRFAPGSGIVTPNIIRAFLIAQYRTLEYNGLVQGSDVFAANLIVQQNATNPNRIDVLWPGILINQLRIFALLAQFQLIVPASPGGSASSAALA